MNYRAAAWIAAATSLIAAGLLFTFWSYGQIEKASEQRKHSREVMTASSDFMDRLKDAETGQRGYVLTGEQAYLQPYLATKDSLHTELQALRARVALEEAQVHLDKVVPLLDAKLAEMGRSISLRRDGKMGEVLALVNSGEGKGLMDGIRAEFRAFDLLQDQAQLQGLEQFDSSMRRLFFIIVCIGVLGAGLSLYFVVYSVRSARERVRQAVHQETQHLLTVQTASNQLLQSTNAALQISQAKLAVTLDSIGDGVIATDALGHITLLNRVAAELTGWTQAQAIGHPLDEVLCLFTKDSHLPFQFPLASVLAQGTVQALTNHTVMVGRDGREFDIADSCAPIRGVDAKIVGAVLTFRNVTSDHAVQRALRDSAALVQAILNTVADGIVTLHATGGALESCNLAVEQMFGYSAIELHGQPLDMLIPEFTLRSQDLMLESEGSTERRTGTRQLRETIGRRKNGSVFPIEMTMSDMTLGDERYFTGLLKDVTARKQTEMALRKSSALQHAIFNSANFSYIATDPQGLIQVFNVGAESMLGYAAKEMVGQVTPAAICEPQDLLARKRLLLADHHTEVTADFESLVFRASRGIEDVFELNYRHKDGTSFPVVVSVNALRDDQHAIIGYLLIGIDNRTLRRLETERFHLDQVLRDRNIELESAREVADRANQAKSDFLSSMSHELRSPLNAILGFAQLIESGVPVPTPSQKASIEQILRAGWYLLELINEVLDLALVESGRLSMSIEPVHLPDVLADCQTMMEPLARTRGILMRFPTFDAPCFVQADSVRVKQVIVNLLSNAIKYNRPNGSVDVTCVSVDSGRVLIRFIDTGNGLPPDKLDQLFQPFNRLGQEGGTEEGTGIGLVVSKRLVEMMGGKIGAVSRLDEGSEFWVELLQADAPHATLLQDAPQRALAPPEEAGAATRTVLYVEDNPANMELVAQLLARRSNLRLLRAEDALRGLALARAELPDLILMDINLPGMGGLDALQLLRENPATRHIPVLALSANAMPRDIEKAMDAGFLCYLTKPIKLAEFMDALDAGLALSQQASPPVDLSKSAL